MAAMGTGLPGGRGDVATTLTDMGGFGAAEMAAAQALDKAARSIADLTDRYIAPGAAEEAKVRAAQDVEAGRFEQRLAITSADVAYNEAAKTGRLAQMATETDTALSRLNLEYALNPDGFAEASQAWRSEVLKTTPGALAMPFAAQYDREAARHLGRIRAARAEADMRETEQAAAARVTRLNERLSLLDPGTQEYDEALSERREIQDARERNPAFTYSTETRQRDDDAVAAVSRAAYVGRLAVQASVDAGGGYMGQAAAYRFLDENILKGENLSDVPMERRLALWAAGRATVDAAARADLEARRAQEHVEREQRERQRETEGEWRLKVELGEVGAAEVQNNPDLSDTAKAALLRGISTRNRQERREDRQDSLESYRSLADMANAGALDDGEIAENLSAGLITPGQAGTLRTLRSRVLRPQVQDVMSVVRDSLNRPGMQLRGQNEILARAEADAATWVQANPGATMDERLNAGRTIAARHTGAPTTTSQSASGNASTQLAALRAERASRAAAGNPMSTSEFNSRRNNIVGRN